MKRPVLIILILVICSAPLCVLAQDSVVPIRQLTAGGQHFDALVAATGRQDLSLEDQLSAARSAWALGLAETARHYWDEALANEAFQGQERTKELLARAILELQEGKLEDARSAAEKTAATMQSSAIRAQFWLLIAEALRLQGALSQSESYYQKAAAEASGETKSEANYLLGECQLKLGRANDARYSFAAVESTGAYAVLSIKRLIEIDLNQKSYEGVLTWVGEGRENFPSEFEDPWVSYATTLALVEAGRMEDAGIELARMKTRHSENEPWYQVASASYEAKLLRGSMPLDSSSGVGPAKTGDTARGMLK